MTVKKERDMETIFTNELGNRISIRVDDGPLLGDVRQVVVTMSGPTSVNENIITRLEAETLLRTLADFIGQRSS